MTKNVIWMKAGTTSNFGNLEDPGGTPCEVHDVLKDISYHAEELAFSSKHTLCNSFKAQAYNSQVYRAM